MSTPNPIFAAASPELIAAINALKVFIASMGTDPTKWAVNYPGAKLILVGTVLQQVPLLTQSEVGALDTAIDAQLNSLIAKLIPPAA